MLKAITSGSQSIHYGSRRPTDGDVATHFSFDGSTRHLVAKNRPRWIPTISILSLTKYALKRSSTALPRPFWVSKVAPFRLWRSNPAGIMGAMHFADSIVIFLLALILFGPKKLPEIARQVGKLMVEFRRASNEFKAQIDDELRSMEQQDRQKKLEASPAQTTALSAPEEDSAEAEEEEALRRRPLDEDYYEDEDEPEDSDEPVILPPSTGETVSADRPHKPDMPVAPPELLEAAAADPHPVYAEALAAEQNGSSNHTGSKPESEQAIVNHG